jgi:ribosomal peptide maturation radical SAM protein 1
MCTRLWFSQSAKVKAREVFKNSCLDNKDILKKFTPISKTLEKHLRDWLTTIDLKEYDLIGFSVCFSQLFSSLAAAKFIKQSSPSTPIVFGGSSCVDAMGVSLQKHFNQVDYVISGEGEVQLEMLCLQLQKQHVLNSEQKEGSKICGQAISDLNTLPTPDYQPYFEELALEFPGQPFNPILPLEFSRGCWWNRCRFCNLNLQWQGYRRKTSEQMVAEVEQLLYNHACLDFTFCDNALPPGEADRFFNEMQQRPEDLSFFAEIRSINDPVKLRDFRRGGLCGVQVGIEALSNSLLKKMDKGTSVIENLAVMKHCAENGIILDGNLIVEYPGSTAEETLETFENIGYALPYHPLSAATFFLGTGSAIAKQPQRCGIRAITTHRNNSLLFPNDIAVNMDMLIQDYRGDKTAQKKRWQPVRRRIKQWQEFHEKRNGRLVPPLSYRDGVTFIVIRQERIDDAPLLHRLRGSSRLLYLYCQTIRSLEEIRTSFPKLLEKSILNFFADLSKKQLLYSENNKFLALAIRAGK